MSIKKYDDFINEEKGYIKNILLSTILALGISKMQAQLIKNDQQKLSIIDTIVKYNLNPVGLDTLRLELLPKVKNSDKFIQRFLKIKPDKTIVVSPDFIRGLDVNVNPFNKSFHFTYTIKF